MGAEYPVALRYLQPPSPGESVDKVVLSVDPAAVNKREVVAVREVGEVLLLSNCAVVH